MSRLNEQSAIYKQWESSTLNGNDQSLLNSRLFFSRNRGYPTALLSVIPYDNEEEKARQERKRADANHWLKIYKQPVRDWRGVSYKSYFQERDIDQEVDDKEGFLGDQGRGEHFRHDPSLIDDPDMTQGITQLCVKFNVVLT